MDKQIISSLLDSAYCIYRSLDFAIVESKTKIPSELYFKLRDMAAEIRDICYKNMPKETK